MKNYQNFQKMTLAFGLLMTLILPIAGLANPKTNALPLSPKLAGNTDEIKKYSKFADAVITNCSNLDNQPRPSGEQLKRCLTTSKELRDRMTAFLGSLDSLVQLFKRKKSWNKEFDEKFIKVAAQYGVDAETIQEIKQAGGLSAFYQKSVAEISESKSAIDAEIKELEAQINGKSSSTVQVFEKISYQPKARARFLGVLKKVAKVAKKIAIAIIAACEASGGFCD